MPLLTVGYPMEKYDTDANLSEVRSVLNETIDQLRYILCNLDTGNVIEAASVKAQNIDVGQAKILDAQIGSLTADKLYAGTIDSGKVSISNKSNSQRIDITGSYIHFTEGGTDRAGIGYLPDGTFVFYINDPSGQQTRIGLDSNGNAYVMGTIESSVINSSSIYASKIVGASKEVYDAFPPSGTGTEVPGVFAEMDQTGIKIMQDEYAADETTIVNRLQKIGLTVDDAGKAILVLGAGHGGASTKTFNGVTYSDNCFVIDKGDGATSLYIYGATDGNITFTNDGGAGKVTVDGIYVKGLSEDVTELKDADFQQQINALENRVAALERAGT